MTLYSALMIQSNTDEDWAAVPQKSFFYILGGIIMSGRMGIMSDHLKTEIAKELGVYETVKSGGWGDVSSRDCGNIVKKAIEMAERSIGS